MLDWLANVWIRPLAGKDEKWPVLERDTIGEQRLLTDPGYVGQTLLHPSARGSNGMPLRYSNNIG